MRVRVSVNGCDDSTIFYMIVSEEELKLLKKLSAKSIKASTYNCEPSIFIKEVEGA